VPLQLTIAGIASKTVCLYLAQHLTARVHVMPGSQTLHQSYHLQIWHAHVVTCTPNHVKSLHHQTKMIFSLIPISWTEIQILLCILDQTMETT
jgi:5'(3')-deoxyribonucleotidase